MRKLTYILFLFSASLFSQPEIGIISQMSGGGSGGGGTPPPPNPGWQSQCSTCPNASLVSTGDEFIPTSVSDLTNGANAGRTAIISNSFSVSGATFAANLVIVPDGGALSGTNINLNGARFVLNGARAFDASARFSSVYNECVTPEMFGAGVLSNDEPPLEAALLNSDYVQNNTSALYTITSGNVFIPDGSRTIKWIGNNSTIRNSANTDGVYMLDFQNNRAEICDLEVDGGFTGSNFANSAEFGFRFEVTDFYMENVWIHDFYNEDGGSTYGVNHIFDGDDSRDTRIYNCQFNGFYSDTDNDPSNGGGVCRGLTIWIIDIGAPVNQPTMLYEIRDSDFFDTFFTGNAVGFSIGDALASSYGRSPTSADEIEHDAVFIVDNCHFYNNTRRGIKSRTSGIRLTNSRIGKMSALNPQHNFPTAPIGLSAFDDIYQPADVKNIYVAGNEFYYVEPAQPPAGTGDWHISFVYTKDAIVENNLFRKPIAYSASPINFGRSNDNCTIRNNTFENGGITMSPGTTASSPEIQVYNNTFTYNTFSGAYEAAVIKNPFSSNTFYDINFYDNQIDVDFSGANTDRWRGIIGTRASASCDFFDITINSNDITFTGTNASGKKFADINGNFGSTNTISNHVVTGIDATGAFVISGTSNFTNTNNTDENSNPLTVQ